MTYSHSLQQTTNIPNYSSNDIYILSILYSWKIYVIDYKLPDNLEEYVCNYLYSLYTCKKLYNWFLLSISFQLLYMKKSLILLFENLDFGPR